MNDWKAVVVRSIHALHLDSVRKQLLVFGVAAALVPAIVASVVLSRHPTLRQESRVPEQLRGASAEAAWAIGEWLNDRVRDLRTAATAYAVVDNMARVQRNPAGPAASQLREYLNSARERSADCEALVLLDARGHFVAGSGGRMSGVQFSLDKLMSLRTGDALVGDAYWDGGINKPALTLAVPIRQAEGQFVGALTAKVNLHAVGDVLERLASDPGTDAYLITDQSRLVMKASGASADLMKTKVQGASIDALLEKEGSVVPSKRGDGQEMLAMLRRIPAPHWSVVIERPEEGVQEANVGNGGGKLGLVFLLLLSAAGIASASALIIARPIGRLAFAASRVAAGDLSVEVPTAGSGEIGQLTQVFKNLVTRVREREGQGELERLSVTDALTGLYNRRHLMGTLSNEVQRSRRLRRTFTVLLADVDHFKPYNDTHGHLAGDAALVKIAEILRKTTRGVDTVARYGGEEFVVMLIEAPIAVAMTVAERIRSRVAAEQFEGGRMTMSIGVAEYPAHGDTPEELIASADAAMYQVKNAGRDGVAAAGAKLEMEAAGKRRRKGES